MSSFKSKLNQLLISSLKSSLSKHITSSFRSDFTSNINADTRYPRHFLSPTNKRTPSIDINNLLSLSNTNTFLIRSPQSIHKEKRIEYMMVFRNGSMKDLHKNDYLLNASSMRSPNQRDDKDCVNSPKSIKSKVHKYSNELNVEHIIQAQTIKARKEKEKRSLLSNHRAKDSNTSMSSGIGISLMHKHIPQSAHYTNLLVNYSKMKVKTNTRTNRKKASSTMNSIDMKNTTNTSSYSSTKKKKQNLS